MTFKKSILIIALTSMVWSFGLELFRPVRKYVSKRKYFKRFRRMLKDSSNLPDKDNASTHCPSCRLPYDKGKKRKLVDTCGHQRCYTCIFTTDKCPLCQPQAQSKPSSTRRPTSFLFSSRQTEAPTRPSTISIDNQTQLSEFAKLHPSTVAEQKLSSYWTRGENIYSQHRVLSSIEIHAQNDMKSENGILPRNTFQSMRKKKSDLKKTASGMNIDSTLLDKSPGSTLSSVSSGNGWPSSSCQNLRSREQSVMSLMSISSQSSTVPMDILKNADGTKLNNQRFSFTQCSNYSLDLSSEIYTDVSSEKGAVYDPLTLKPLYFEVPQSEADPPFIGRQWLFKEIEMVLTSENENKKGIVITGGPGTGKTAFILQLVDYSSFGRKWKETLNQTTQDIYCKIKDLAGAALDGDQMSISSRDSVPRSQEAIAINPVLHHLASRLVGYHFCQADYDSTCLIPDFVHSLAAQLCQAPLLTDYRDFLLKNPGYQQVLELKSCIMDPDIAFSKGILEPLKLLPKLQQEKPFFIVIDSIHEALTFKSEDKYSIAHFLSNHINEFPTWLKVILTARTSHQDLLTSLPLQVLTIDGCSSNVNVHQDILAYIQYRICNSVTVQKNIAVNRKEEGDTIFMKFAEYTAMVSKGSFLYAKLILDLLHQGCLVIKSSSFSVIPINLHQVYMLLFNLRFTTNDSFKKVSSVLDVCLASPYPLTILETYHSINSRQKKQSLLWTDFLLQIEILTVFHILVYRQDGSLMISHPSLREWLIMRSHSKEEKFVCDIRQGHANLALRMTRLETPVTPDHAVELVYHLIQANVFFEKNSSGFTDNDYTALWLQYCLLDPTKSLVNLRNVFTPDIQICRLLLQAGANPNAILHTASNKHILTVACELGNLDLINLLLEFKANCNIYDEDSGITPLMAACRKGHYDVVKILLSAGAELSIKDKNGRTAINHAGEGGCSQIINDLLKYFSVNNITIYKEAIHRALTSAASKGHLEVCRNLLSWPEVQINSHDLASGHTALTFACSNGHDDVCKLLIQARASVTISSKDGTPPIIWAVKNEHKSIVTALLNYNTAFTLTDKAKKTSLIWAAVKNNSDIVNLLLEKGSSVEAKDNEGLTALTHAVIENNITVAQCLLDHKANIESTDVNKKTPLIFAVKHKDGNMVNLLLKNGANIEHKDINGTSPLLSAIREENMEAVSKLLHKGAKLGPCVWADADKQPNILLILLHKLLSDGVVLYKKDKIAEASQRFQYALKKFPKDEIQKQKKVKFQQLFFYLQLGLARCNIKVKNYDKAIQATDEAIKINSESFEALYLRAKARNEAGLHSEALTDVATAMNLSNSDSKSKKILQNLRADILTSSKIVCPIDGIDSETSIAANERSPHDENANKSVCFQSQPYCSSSASHPVPGKRLFCLTNKLAPTVH